MLQKKLQCLTLWGDCAVIGDEHPNSSPIAVPAWSLHTSQHFRLIFTSSPFPFFLVFLLTLFSLPVCFFYYQSPVLLLHFKKYTSTEQLQTMKTFSLGQSECCLVDAGRLDEKMKKPHLSVRHWSTTKISKDQITCYVWFIHTCTNILIQGQRETEMSLIAQIN